METKCAGSLDPSQNSLYVLVRRCPIYAWNGRNNQFVFLTWDLCSVKAPLYYDHAKLLPREWNGDSKGIKQAAKRVLQWHNPAAGACAGVPGPLVAPGQSHGTFPKDTLLPHHNGPARTGIKERSLCESRPELSNSCHRSISELHREVTITLPGF